MLTRDNTDNLACEEDLTKLVAEVQPGQTLINIHGERAVVIELLPDDPEYFARLRSLDQGDEFAALSENFAAWRPYEPGD